MKKKRRYRKFGWALQDKIIFKTTTLIEQSMNRGFSMTASILYYARRYPNRGLQQYYADRFLLSIIRKTYNK